MNLHLSEIDDEVTKVHLLKASELAAASSWLLLAFLNWPGWDAVVVSERISPPANQFLRLEIC